MANLKGIIRSTLGFLSFAIIITLTLTTCSAPGSGLGGGQGTISINFGDGARAAVSAWPPDNTALSYITHTVTLTGAGGTQTHNIAKGQTTANISAASGNWDVKVESFINGYKFGSGTTRVNVAAGQSTACSVNMNKSYPNAGYYVASNLTEWNDAITAINTTASGDYAIFVTDNISVTGITSISTYSFPSGTKVTIIGNHTISLSLGYLLNIAPNQEVTLIDTNLAGGIGGVLVRVEGILNMRGNSSISDRVSSVAGGGVAVESSGTFNMYDNSSVYDNQAGINGGGVYISGGRFNMYNNSSVYDNQASTNGGGVFADTGSIFTMSGGTITGNTAGSSGGGVILSSSAAFTMSGGTITDNTAVLGGGVYVNGGTFTMNSPAVAGSTGSIRGNTASIGNHDVERISGTIYGTAITPYGTTYAYGW